MPKKDRVRRFDFRKKPHRPSFLMGVAKGLISFPDLKKRGAVIRRNGMEALDGKPYLLFITHSSMVDFNIMLKATHPYPVSNVMSLEGFNTYTEPLMRSLGVLGKRKFIPDRDLIRNIDYCLHKLGTIFVLFPETRYSLDGCTSYLPDTLGGLVKMMKVPAAVIRIHGNFVAAPQWNKINKKTFVEADMFPVVLPEEVPVLTPEEINARLREAFRYDDYAWQYENRIRVDDEELTRGLHCLLYKCPHCGEEFRMDSAGHELWCEACGKRWRQDEYGRLTAEEGETEFAHIPDWSAWERSCVRREVEEGTYRFEDTVRVETLPGSRRFYVQGEGKLLQTTAGFRLECTAYGEPVVLEKPALSMYSVHIEYDYLGRGDCVDLSVKDESYWCYVKKRDQITKISFATEEIYELARRKLEERRKP